MSTFYVNGRLHRPGEGGYWAVCVESNEQVLLEAVADVTKRMSGLMVLGWKFIADGVTENSQFGLADRVVIEFVYPDNIVIKRATEGFNKFLAGKD